MNPCLKNLNRIECIVTYACTGRCIHCSEGDHKSTGTSLDSSAAVRAIHTLREYYTITSLMTFGGEPLLYPEAVFAIQKAARDTGIPKRQLITNGFFTRDPIKIQETAEKLAECEVNDILLSADAFHQAAIPLDVVLSFAQAMRNCNLPVRIQPAWLVSPEHENPYNLRTKEILRHFTDAGFSVSDGNIVFPEGNAKKHLREYFEDGKTYVNPYEEDPRDLRSVSFEPDGSVLGGNICSSDIMTILENYNPKQYGCLRSE